MRFWTPQSRRPWEPIVVRVRKLTAVVGMTAVMALALGGLTACDSKVGQAAIVGGHRISESDLGKFLSPAGPSPSALSAAANAGQGLYPKTEVVQFLVQQELFTQALAKNGGVPSKGELATLHDQAAATFLGTQLTGAELNHESVRLRTITGTLAPLRPGAAADARARGGARGQGQCAVVGRSRGRGEQAAHQGSGQSALRQVGPGQPVSLARRPSNIPDFLKLGGDSSAAPSAASN